jgi:hypothetical protein
MFFFPRFPAFSFEWLALPSAEGFAGSPAAAILLAS